MEVCQGTGSGVGVRKTQEKWHARCAGVCGRVHRWAWSLGAGLARVGVHVCAKSWNGGNRVWWAHRGTPPIGKVVPLGLVCDEKVLQDGWQGWTDTSKCGNVAGFGMCVHTHALSAGG